MKNAIFYFTGTGNSLAVARDIAEKLDDCEVLLIPSCMDKEINTGYERVGLLFPVYGWGPPRIVSRFVSKLGGLSQATYIFAGATCANDPGAVLHSLEKLLNKNGLNLSAGFSVRMPGNHIGYYERDSESEFAEKISTWQHELPGVSGRIMKKTVFFPDRASAMDRILKSGFLYAVVSRQFPKGDRRYSITDACNGCGICARVCRVQNITLCEKKPV